MPITAKQVYNEVIRSLSPTEQLRLATLILNQLVQVDSLEIDQSDSWTDLDRMDVINFSLQQAAYLFTDEEVIL
jgi:hypothetical protein